MLYVAARNDDTYITENQTSASKLSKLSIIPMGNKGISMGDVIAYFKFQIPDKKVVLTPHNTFRDAVKVSDASLLENYLNEATEMLQLGEFDPERVKWDEQREANQRALDSLVKK